MIHKYDIYIHTYIHTSTYIHTIMHTYIIHTYIHTYIYLKDVKVPISAGIVFMSLLLKLRSVTF